MDEIWRPIAIYNDMRPRGVPRFEVSTFGRVRESAYVDECGRHHKERLLNQHVDSFGYAYVNMVLTAFSCRSYCVHGLVAVTFAANPYKYNRIRHKDGDKSDNHVDNVEFVKYAGTTVEHTKMKEQVLNLVSSSDFAIRQYTFDGRLVGEYESSYKALEILGVKTYEVESCCTEKPKGRLVSGYAWRYVDDDELFGVDVTERRTLIGVRAVRRYSLSGEVIESASIKTAASKCQVPERGILNCCLRKQISCGGYVWRFWDDDEFENGASVRDYLRSHDKRFKS